MSEKIEQCEDGELVANVTAVVREADRMFERVGGGSRHWVRDCFLPLLNRAGLCIQPTANVGMIAAAPDLYRALFEIREACCSGMGQLPAADIARGQLALEKADGRLSITREGPS